MGQEFAGYREWSEERELDWASVNDEKHFKMQQLVKDLNKLYVAEKALHELDYDTEGFMWIDNLSWEENLCSFVRKGKKPQDLLLVVCNFDMINHEEYKVGVPKAGKYKEIFNTNDEKYGGNGNINARVKTSKKEEVHGREDSITISLPPLTVAIFKYSAVKSTVAEELEKQYIKAETGEKEPAKEEKAVKGEKEPKEENTVKEEKASKDKNAIKEEKALKEENTVKEEKTPKYNKNLKESNTQGLYTVKNKQKKNASGKSKASKKKK